MLQCINIYYCHTIGSLGGSGYPVALQHQVTTGKGELGKVKLSCYYYYYKLVTQSTYYQ